MQKLADILPGFPKRGSSTGTIIDPEEREREFAEWYNSIPGDLDGYDCKVCKNRGKVAKVIERLGGTETVFIECACMEIRKSLVRMERSGLYDLAKRCTFDNFRVDEDWQKSIRDKCELFTCAENSRRWLFIGGQPGCGKTHLGVATTMQIMQDSKKDARYFVWPDAIRKTWGDFDEYKRFVSEAKNATILYLDDLFKPAQGKPPSANEIECAFEIINSRYNAEGKTTVITCEYTISELCGIDEAIGSRIIEGCRTTGSCLSIAKKPGRNFRLRGMAEI